MAGILSISYTSGNVLQASQLNQANQELLNYATAIPNAHLVGGITKDKLSENKIPVIVAICLVPAYIAGDDTDAPAELTVKGDIVPATLPFTLKENASSQLCSIEYRASAVTASSGSEITVTALLNGSINIGNVSTEIVAANKNYRLALADPISNSFVNLNDGDYIEFVVGKSSSNNPSVRGLWAYVTYKTELVG